MQRLTNRSFRHSPKDLIAYLEGGFAAWCERNHAERSPGSHDGDPGNGAFVLDLPDEEMDLVIRRGIEHEAAHLARLRGGEPGPVEISRDDAAHDATWRALRDGAPIIFQGELRKGAWMGIAAFVHRIDGDCDLGAWFYEPRDTKLARSAKPYFLLQLCAYADMLESMQGRQPERFGFVFGDRTETHFRAGRVALLPAPQALVPGLPARLDERRPSGPRSRSRPRALERDCREATSAAPRTATRKCAPSSRSRRSCSPAALW